MDRPLRVLQLGKFYPLEGGVERVMYDLALGLGQRGIRCDMLCAAGDGEERTVKVGENTDVITCRTWTKLDGAMISPSMISKLIARRRRYDIIHVHHPDPMAALALLLSCFRGKVVLHWHSDILKQRHMMKLYAPIQKWLLRRANVVVQTTPVYVDGSEALQSVKKKLICLPIGVKPIQMDSHGAEWLKAQYPGKKIIFALGRLVNYKGMEYLIWASKRLGEDYMILIGGLGPLRGYYESEIAKVGVQDRVKLVGRIPDEELPAYFGACTLFCMPSVYKNEAFGIVQIEAFSCGKPVVTTNIPNSGVPWVNAHGVSGLNVTPRSASELAQAIKTLCENPSEYERLSRGARERFFSMFTYDKMIDDCIKIYEDLR